MPLTDLHDLPLSTDSELAAQRYREGQALMLAAWPGAAEAFEAAIAADPEFALPYTALARLSAMSGDAERAADLMTRAASLVQRRGYERERSHVDVLATIAAGRSGQGLKLALAHAERWPRDALILATPLGAFGLFAFSGMADHDQARVALCEQHASRFADDDWWFLTSYGWALAENGDVARGRAMLERALDIRRHNANTVHALAHAMYEGGAGSEAEALISSWLPSYDRSGILHGHIAWHAALAALERGDPEAALQAYRQHVHPSVSKGMAINIVSDAASLLWRLDLYGHAAPEGAWREIADYAAVAFPRAGHAFIDVHMAMIEASVGDGAAVDRRVSDLEVMVADGRLGAGAFVPAMARAAQAFANADYALCATLLAPVAADAERIGGSGAQRDVVEDTLLVALARSGETEEAARLLDRRLRRRPLAGDTQWRAKVTKVG